jgi:hypothetical protein
MVAIFIAAKFCACAKALDAGSDVKASPAARRSTNARRLGEKGESSVTAPSVTSQIKSEARLDGHGIGEQRRIAPQATHSAVTSGETRRVVTSGKSAQRRGDYSRSRVIFGKTAKMAVLSLPQDIV